MNRRGFLKTIGLAIAGTVVGSSITPTTVRASGAALKGHKAAMDMSSVITQSMLSTKHHTGIVRGREYHVTGDIEINGEMVVKSRYPSLNHHADSNIKAVVHKLNYGS